MAGMLEFGVFLELAAYVSVSDIRMEAIMRRAGWPPVRLGGTMDTGTDMDTNTNRPPAAGMAVRLKVSTSPSRLQVDGSRDAPRGRQANKLSDPHLMRMCSRRHEKVARWSGP